MKTTVLQADNRAARRGLVPAKPPVQRKLCTIPNVCAQLDVGRTTVYSLIDDGTLRRVKIGARTLIPQADVDAFVAGLLEGGVA
ncbi:helix-turn-helix domain-containing protein [Mycolicibacterium moriokaense]|nr:helix-turn-helix domain-containing protein [Mycolicibacterium moriokaense]